MNKFTTTVSVLALAASASAGLSNLRITEIYTGVSGADGTADWFELTNFGPNALSTAGLFYDDASASISAAGALDVTTIDPGESIVVVVGDATDVAVFSTVWPGAFDVVATNGGGTLASGDAVNIMLGDGSIVTSLAHTQLDDLHNNNLSTAIVNPDDSLVPHVLGEPGTVESLPFFNDSIGFPPSFNITLIGSPGFAVPTPGAAALLGLGGLASVRRRR